MRTGKKETDICPQKKGNGKGGGKMRVTNIKDLLKKYEKGSVREGPSFQAGLEEDDDHGDEESGMSLAEEAFMLGYLSS